MSLPTSQVRASWQAFHDEIAGLRPELYRYCRHLTRSPYDAEDLVQDTLAKAFVTVSGIFDEIRDPRAWLFRVASNVWLDRVRDARQHVFDGELPERPAPGMDPQLAREAAGTLLSRLSAQERAAVVLKDVFDFSLEETAAALSTTSNAIKAALHRGRGKLDPAASAQVEAIPPPSAAVSEFVAAFNARDLDRLTALLLDTTTSDMVGAAIQYGRTDPLQSRFGMVKGILGLDEGVEAHHPEGERPAPARAELRVHRGGQVVLFWWPCAAHWRCAGSRCPDTTGEVVRSVARIEDDGEGHIQRQRFWFWTDDVLAEVCSELQVPFQLNGYRYWGPETPHSAGR